jgi:hypothetical protein
MARTGRRQDKRYAIFVSLSLMAGTVPDALRWGGLVNETLLYTIL